MTSTIATVLIDQDEMRFAFQQKIKGKYCSITHYRSSWHSKEISDSAFRKLSSDATPLFSKKN